MMAAPPVAGAPIDTDHGDRGAARPPRAISGGLFRKYALVFAALVGGALLLSGLAQGYFSAQESLIAVAQSQSEKATVAAAQIGQFVRGIELQIIFAAQAPEAAATDPGGPSLSGPDAERRRNSLLRLLREAPAITELSYLDASGREQVHVSRTAVNVVGSQTDFSQDPMFIKAQAGATYFGPVSYRNESEPYMTIAVREGQAVRGVVAAQVNLKFIWDVVSQIKIGQAGRAYVVDSQGRLVAHPDISLVLKKTDLSALPQVEAALARSVGTSSASPAPEDAGLYLLRLTQADRNRVLVVLGLTPAAAARDHTGTSVLASFQPVDPLGWWVFAEQPRNEVLAPVYVSLLRTVLLLILGLALALLASLLLARRMATPIRTLQAGAARVGAGALDERFEVRTGDELEALAEEFNRMTGRLQESYAGLEQRVEERTRDLAEALEQQTATAEVLNVISRSPTDVQPVLDAIAESAARVCGATDAHVSLVEGETLRLVAHYGSIPVNEEPLPINPGGAYWRVIKDGETVQINDVLTEGSELGRRIAQEGGWRTSLMAPLQRQGVGVGYIGLRRTEVQPFSEKEIGLLKTFADQAVIAIENVRLFHELQERTREQAETLEEQAATNHILEIISQSPTDVQPVLDAIVESAAEVIGSDDVVLRLREGDDLVIRAHVGPITAANVPIPVDLPENHWIRQHGALHIPDAQAQDEFEHIRRSRSRTFLLAPLRQRDRFAGAIILRRMEVHPFTDRQIKLIETFADQAVIAIENVRLFNEIQEKSEQLKREGATLEAIMASMSDGLVVFNTNHEIQYCNAQAGDLLGSSPEKLRGLKPDSAFRAIRSALVDSDAAESEWSRGFASIAEEPSFELAFEGPRDVVAQLFPVNGPEADTLGVGMVLRDMTAEHDLQRTKDELVSVVSHELRTPLASLVGFAELLLIREYPDAQRKQYLSVMVEEGRRLTTLINDFLDLQRMESGRQQLELAAADIGDLVTHVLEAAGEDPQHPRVVEIPPRLPPVRVDAARVQEVLGNLISNAQKYSPAGGEVRISARVLNGMIEVSVEDQGLGLPPEAIPRLFQKFFRVDNTDRRSIKGTGLGLAICKGIVEGHGGRIWAESEGLGRGSRFAFTLPVIEAAKLGDVLVVEDDVGFARLLEAEFAIRGLSVVHAPSAELALEYLAHARPSGMVLDLILPGLPGETLLEQLASTDSGGPALPIVVVTVKDLTTGETEALERLGAIAVLAKGSQAAIQAADTLAPLLGKRVSSARRAGGRDRGGAAL